MDNKSLTATLRKKLEDDLFIEGMMPDQINLFLDRAEQLFEKAYKAGYKTASMLTDQEWSNKACLGYVILGAQRLHRVTDKRNCPIYLRTI